MHELEIHPSRGRSRDSDAYVRIHRAYPRGGETLVLRAPSVREARAWTESIVQAAAKAKEGIMAAVGVPGGAGIGVGVGMGHVGGATRGSADVNGHSPGVLVP